MKINERAKELKKESTLISRTSHVSIDEFLKMIRQFKFEHPELNVHFEIQYKPVLS